MAAILLFAVANAAYEGAEALLAQKQADLTSLLAASATSNLLSVVTKDFGSNDALYKDYSASKQAQIDEYTALQKMLEYEIASLKLAIAKKKADAEAAAAAAAAKAAAEAAALALLNTQIRASCDNVYVMYVNGKNVLSGSDWTSPNTVTTPVRPGDIIFVDATNQGGPAALMVELIANGKDQSTGVGNWRCTQGAQSIPSSAGTVNSWPAAVQGSYTGYGRTTKPNTKWVWAPGGETSSTKAGCALVVQ